MTGGRKKDGAVSLVDVARLAGVSTQTASRVANGSNAVRAKTREKVLSAMRELGYRPSFAGRSLRLQRYKAVGLVTSDVLNTGNTKRLSGILDAADDQGYAITVLKPRSGYPYTIEQATQRMLELPVDAMIYNLNRTFQIDDFLTFVPDQRLRCVAISSVLHPYMSCIDADQHDCSRQIVSYLAARGHRRIRFVSGPAESIASSQREEGWREALLASGLELSESLCGDWTADSGYMAGCVIAKDSACTAVYAANDDMAYGVMIALAEHGKEVPNDISVVGVDDSLSHSVPRTILTSVAFDDWQIGQRAFGATCTESTDPLHMLVPGHIVERASVRQL